MSKTPRVIDPPTDVRISDSRVQKGRTPYIAPLEAPVHIEESPADSWHPRSDIQAIERAYRTALQAAKESEEATEQALRSVLVATDLSPASQVSLQRAVSLPLASAAEITLLHVIPKAATGAIRKKAQSAALGSMHRQAEAVLKWAREHQLNDAKIAIEVREGALAQTIVRRARTHQAELIVIGRHGSRPVFDWFVGTTAQAVLRATSQPVFLVRQKIEGPYQRALMATEIEVAA